MLLSIFCKFLPHPHQCLSKQVQAPPLLLSHRLILLESNPPDPIKRTRFDKDQTARLHQGLLQLLVLPGLVQIAEIYDLFPMLDPRFLVKRRDHPPQRLNVFGISVRLRVFFEDQLEGGGVRKECCLTPHHPVLGGGERVGGARGMRDGGRQRRGER